MHSILKYNFRVTLLETIHYELTINTSHEIYIHRIIKINTNIIIYFVGYPQIRCDIFGGICSLYGWLT